ncbi:MAG: hypothetical protein KQJ78_07125 [Deltaproteobacteria bacterium]|nr:hypothetical protein [Deltaproteobacteria bacterium]
MSRSIAFVHLGLPKAASTWLQTTAFTHPDIRLVPLHQFSPEFWRFMERAEHLFSPDDFRPLFRDLVEATPPGGLVGLSYERLSGGLLHSRDAACLARRVALCLGEIKVVLLLRAQPAMLASIYDQYVKNGGTLGFRRFLQDRLIAGPAVVEKLAYHRLVEMYFEIFGRDRVLVGFAEELRRDEVGFLDRLWRFLGLGGFPGWPGGQAPAGRANSSLTPPCRIVKRCLNQFFLQPFNPAPWGPLPFAWHQFMRFRLLENGLDPWLRRLRPSWPSPLDTLSPAERAQLRAGFARSNEILGELLGRDLGELGFPLPGQPGIPA